MILESQKEEKKNDGKVEMTNDVGTCVYNVLDDACWTI